MHTVVINLLLRLGRVLSYNTKNRLILFQVQVSLGHVANNLVRVTLPICQHFFIPNDRFLNKFKLKGHAILNSD
jgi:hypothetical protein